MELKPGQHTAECPKQNDRSGQTESKTNADGQEALPKDQCMDTKRSGSYRHSNPNLLRPAGRGVRNHSIHTGRRHQQRKGGERRQQGHDEPAIRN
jgi:hypothetical protein